MCTHTHTPTTNFQKTCTYDKVSPKSYISPSCALALVVIADVSKWVVKHKPCLSASDAVISDILIPLQIIEESRLMKETVLKQSGSIALPIKLFVCSPLCKSLQLTFLLPDCHRV